MEGGWWGGKMFHFFLTQVLPNQEKIKFRITFKQTVNFLKIKNENALTIKVK